MADPILPTRSPSAPSIQAGATWLAKCHDHMGIVERRHGRSGDELRQPPDADRRSLHLDEPISRRYPPRSRAARLQTHHHPPNSRRRSEVRPRWRECPYGRIVSHWQCEDGKLTLDITIPPNTTATVYVPAKDALQVTEGGKPAAQAEGIKFPSARKVTPPSSRLERDNIASSQHDKGDIRMKRMIGTLLCICWLAAVGLLFSGSLRADEPVWITVAGPHCPIIRKEFTIPAQPKQGHRPDRGSGPFRAAGQWTTGRRRRDPAALVAVRQDHLLR